MKRAASTDRGDGLRRSTRLRRTVIKQDTRFTEESHHRALGLMATPLLRALPLVLANSGFLYKHECINAIAACKDWHDVWTDVEDELPDYCQVEISVGLDGGNKNWPQWAKIRGLETIIPTHEFVRQIFDKVNDLKVAAKPGKRKKNEARDALPKWGVDFHHVRLSVWGPTKRNDGGIYVSLIKRKVTRDLRWTFHRVLRNWNIRLDNNLLLWTGIRKWDVYDGQPLWDWEFVEDYDWSDDEDEDGAVVAPAPRLPPGPGNIDYYFAPARPEIAANDEAESELMD